MKELSIEEKAKRYDEAIKRAREYDFSLTGVCAGDIIEDVFPELKESENVRIRKVLKEYFINSFKINGVAAICGVHIKDIIAWLEKQGENDRNMKFVTDDAYQRGYDEGIKVTLEKKCEQKPVPDWMPKFLDELRLKKNYFDWEEHKDIEGGILAIIKWMNPNYFNEKDDEQKPQGKSALEAAKEEKVDNQNCVKPADKVEPKFKVGDRVRYKGHKCDGVITEITDTDYICGNAKLPISTQNNLEIAWSEEDETIKNNLVWAISNDCIRPQDREDYCNWLKSLKDRVQPKSQWKPSEEMLEALYRAIPENVMEISEDEMLLDKLYQGLKYGRVLSKK